MTTYRKTMGLLIICIGISACVAFAEDTAVNGATIRGEVTEAIGKQNPIEGATVKIISPDGKERTIKTDAKGKYEYKGLPAGRYTIKVHKRGYGTRVGRSKVVSSGSELSHPVKMTKRDDFETLFAEGLLQHVVEDIGKRYKLDVSIVKKLHKSIFEAFDTVLEQANGEEIEEFAEAQKYGSIGLIIDMLAHPDCKAAFAKYLTETQLQDYLDFMKAWRQQVQQTMVQFMTAVLDQTLSLTVNQRKHMAKLLLDTISNKPEFTFLDVMDEPISQGIVNLIHNELEAPLESVLNQTQTKICYVMIDYYDGKDLVKVEVFDPQTDEIVEKDEPDEIIPKSQKWVLTEAILMAHTEQLGTLNESASKRMKLVTNGVVQQYIEMELPDVDDNFEFFSKIDSLTQAFMLKSISQEQALERLESIKKELWGERDTNKPWDENELSNITKHPLYQQAIKDVLSEDAYLQYKARQTERENFHIQTARNLILAHIDMIMLLNDVQREQLKITAEQLTISSLSYERLQLMSIEFFIRMDQDVLSPGQQSIFKGGR